MRVKQVLDLKPIQGVETISLQETLTGLTRLLAEKRIGAVIVTEPSGEIAGVISERDIVRALAQDGEGALSSAVSRYMTREVVTAGPNDQIVSLLEKMTSGRFRHMPVIENGALIGVVSIGDLVKARIDLLQRDNQALEEFIRS